MSMKQAREKITKDVERICRQRLILEERLRELREAMNRSATPVRGFNLEDIERASAAPTELQSRIRGIEIALKKSFFDDPEFCRNALVYLQEITPEVNRLETERREFGNRIERLKRELDVAEKTAEKERSRIDVALDDLFSPLGETIYSVYHDCPHSGVYILRQLQKRAEGNI